MATYQQFKAAVQDIKNTVSGKVEYNNGSASLRLILALIEDFAHYNMVFQVADINALKAMSGADANFLQIQDTASGVSAGIYSYRTTGVADNINSFDATGGGIWKKANLPD